MAQELSGPAGPVVEVHARMPTAKIAISIRITPEQYEAWSKAAADEPSLNQWIQRCCDAAASAAGHKPVAATTKPRKRRTRRPAGE
jgi:hypothetical protein